jgi:1,4-alpha-glucan branching enzyme
MLDWDHDTADRDEEFIARIAAPLRAPERVDPTFRDRLMPAVRRAARSPRAERLGWWGRRWAVQLTPITGLALAAGIAGVAALGAVTTGRATAPVAAVAQHDTVYVVRFVFVAPSARNVAIVGDFNNWDRTTTALAPTGNGGLWTASVTLPAGRHEYAFIVDGARWTADPLAAITIHDDFGTASSILTVGSRAS